MESAAPLPNEKGATPTAPTATPLMTYQQAAKTTAGQRDEELGRILGACALIGVGLVVASMAPVTSPVVLGRIAFEAGRLIGRR